MAKKKVKKDSEKMRFLNFGIETPYFIGKPPTEDYCTYNFNVVKYTKDSISNKECNFVIGTLTYEPKDFTFKFKSCGLRYLEEREDGLEEWLLKWCELKAIEFQYKNKEEFLRN